MKSKLRPSLGGGHMHAHTHTHTHARTHTTCTQQCTYVHIHTKLISGNQKHTGKSWKNTVFMSSNFNLLDFAVIRQNCNFSPFICLKI